MCVCEQLIIICISCTLYVYLHDVCRFPFSLPPAPIIFFASIRVGAKCAKIVRVAKMVKTSGARPHLCVSDTFGAFLMYFWGRRTSGKARTWDIAKKGKMGLFNALYDVNAHVAIEYNSIYYVYMWYHSDTWCSFVQRVWLIFFHFLAYFLFLIFMQLVAIF
jgi:hypothetical protein